METTTTTGTGALTLAGAVTGFRAFSAAMSVADTCRYGIEAVDGSGNPTGDWETGFGTYSGANTLTRTTVARSSNSDAAVSFAAGTKRVFMGPIASSLPVVDPSGNERWPHASANTTPPADNLAFSPQRVNASGGRLMLRYLGEDGSFATLQPHIGRNTILAAQAPNGGATDLVVIGGVLPASTGTLTARAVAATNRATRARRVGKVSTAVAGNLVSWHTGNANQAQWTTGGASGAGFLLCCRWAVSDAASVATAHMFLGMSSSVVAPSGTANPNTLTNTFGVAQLNGGTNLNMVYGGSAAQTAIDLGASFPAADTTALYELILYARPDVNNKVTYRVENISSGAVASGELTGTAGTALPANTTLLGPRFYRTNNATALAVGLDMSIYYIESDL